MSRARVLSGAMPGGVVRKDGIPHCCTEREWSCEGPRLRYADGGRLLKLHFRQSQAAEWNSEMFYNRGGKRGQCKGFSFGSRRRLLDHLNSVSKGAALPYFLTLTLPDDAFHDSVTELSKRAKCWVATFLKRLARVAPTASGFWRMEWKCRQSGRYEGKLFPHFHLLVWGLPERKARSDSIHEDEAGRFTLTEHWEGFVDCVDNQLTLELVDLWSEASKSKTDFSVRCECIGSGRVFAGSAKFVERARDLATVCEVYGAAGVAPELSERARKMSFQDWASLAWYHVVDSHNLDHLQAGSRVERVKTWGGVMWYCAKYLAKSDSSFLIDLPLGRSWGIFNRAGVPWAKLVDLDLDGDVGVRLRRVMRHYLERRFGRKVEKPFGVTLYCDVEQFRRLWERPPPDPF